MDTQSFFGNTPSLTQLIYEIELSLHLLATTHLMKFGIITSQMLLIYVNLVRLSGSYIKDRLNNEKYNQNRCDEPMLATTMVLIPFFITTWLPTKFYPQETSVSSHKPLLLQPPMISNSIPREGENTPVQSTDKLNENGKRTTEEQNFERRTRGK